MVDTASGRGQVRLKYPFVALDRNGMCHLDRISTRSRTVLACVVPDRNGQYGCDRNGQCGRGSR